MTTFATLAVALLHSVVLAQQAPPPLPPPAFPPPYYPPPGYYRWRPPPPPMYYESYYGPRETYIPPWRRVSLTLSLGAAAVTDSSVDSRDSGTSFGLRLSGFIVQRLALTVGVEGTSAWRDGYNETQWAFLAGLQWFFLPQVYLRGAVGAGSISTDAEQARARYFGGEDEGLHPAFGAGLGVEFFQTANFALGVELAGTWLWLPKADWNSLGANLVMSFF